MGEHDRLLLAFPENVIAAEFRHRLVHRDIIVEHLFHFRDHSGTQRQKLFSRSQGALSGTMVKTSKRPGWRLSSLERPTSLFQ